MTAAERLDELRKVAEAGGGVLIHGRGDVTCAKRGLHEVVHEDDGFDLWKEAYTDFTDGGPPWLMPIFIKPDATFDEAVLFLATAISGEIAPRKNADDVTDPDEC